MPFSLVVFPLGGASFPLKAAHWEIRDLSGEETAAATVSETGVVTAVSAGTVKVRASIDGSAIAPVESTLTIYPQVLMGRRVVVLSGDTMAPIANATVLGCLDSDCASPAEVLTDADGAAAFPLLPAGTPATFTAVSNQLRSDGLPLFERASLVGMSEDDLLLPLRENSVRATAGASSSVSFSAVTTTGDYWAGFVTTSTTDLPSLTPARLLGENFSTELPGLSQSIPVPSSVVLYTSPGLGIPQPVKPNAFGKTQSGKRFSAAWAGKANLDIALSLRSTDFLSYLGAFDYAQQTNGTFTSRPYVPDMIDINGNGLCSVPTTCPLGGELVPDYGNFTALSFEPRRQQKLRTRVVLPPVAATLATILVTAVQVDRHAGVLPVGFSSQTAGAVGTDGNRSLDPVSVRSGSPYNGLEASAPGIWVLATDAAGRSFSARLRQFSSMPTEVTIEPFLPVPIGGAFSVATHAFTPGQPEWNALKTGGANLARVGLTGSEVRHVIYFVPSEGQTELIWPSIPPGALGIDPTTEDAAQLEVVAAKLNSNESVFSFTGLSLLNWVSAIEAYARFDN